MGVIINSLTAPPLSGGTQILKHEVVKAFGNQNKISMGAGVKKDRTALVTVAMANAAI